MSWAPSLRLPKHPRRVRAYVLAVARNEKKLRHMSRVERADQAANLDEVIAGAGAPPPLPAAVRDGVDRQCRACGVVCDDPCENCGRKTAVRP